MVVLAVGTCLHQVCTRLCAPRATTLLLHGLGLCATTSAPPKSPHPAQAAREHPFVHPGLFCLWALRWHPRVLAGPCSSCSFQHCHLCCCQPSHCRPEWLEEGVEGRAVLCTLAASSKTTLHLRQGGAWGNTAEVRLPRCWQGHGCNAVGVADDGQQGSEVGSQANRCSPRAGATGRDMGTCPPPGHGVGVHRAGRGRQGLQDGCMDVPLSESFFWTHRPLSSSRNWGRQGPQAPEPGGQNSRRCRVQSRLRGHGSAAGQEDTHQAEQRGWRCPWARHLVGSQAVPDQHCCLHKPQQLSMCSNDQCKLASRQNWAGSAPCTLGTVGWGQHSWPSPALHLAMPRCAHP